MKYWLLKTEPDVYSLDDLKEAGVDTWDGIRNYQARNIIRDEMKENDKVFIYHSRTQPIGIVGEAKIAREAYPDHTQFDPEAKYYDPKSDPDNPRWLMVDVAYVRHFPECISLAKLKSIPELAEMMGVKKGSRLSVQPVREEEWNIIQAMTGD
jgi:predicted RNA-binding protein with PUA-like domain